MIKLIKMISMKYFETHELISWSDFSSLVHEHTNVINEQTNQRLLFWVNTYYKYCIQMAMLCTINEIKSRGYKKKIYNLK